MESILNLHLDEIEISKITKNPQNPRGQYVRSEDEHFEYLKRSIKTFGLIVPLVVQKIDEEKYLLIDGERRYNALKELGIKK
ncbi:MAG: ParB N-terminal domain-containing protein, partial [Thermodesulfovibrionia bacterium]|nr:ParB N-terminal domain-containing protein [Thermodesulfovibrionia bacterium]